MSEEAPISTSTQPRAAPPGFARADAFKLFLMGFLTLFVELALIRYLAGSIWNLGYFPNLVLLSVFIGMGLGFMLHHWVPERCSPALVHAAAFALLGLLAYVAVSHPTVPGFTTWNGDIGGDLYFTATPESAVRQSFLPFVICMAGVVLVCALLSQWSAKLFRKFRPLTAYTLDICGSCAGIAAFIAVSWLGIPAWVWFLVFAAILTIAQGDRPRTRWLPLLPGVVMALLVHKQDTVLTANPGYTGLLEVFWSPYQKVEYIDSPENPRRIFVNGISHQAMFDDAQIRRDFYQTIYQDRAQRGAPSVRSVLVLGAGSGNDVEAALLNGVEHIDAVEIDPRIAALGRRYQPNHPYESAKVNLVIDDGRAFMTRTTRRYDLVIFALTDSLVKVSSISQLRLENYLFTVESVRRAFALLEPGGDLVFYNYYRQPWLRRKIEEMIRRAGGEEPREVWKRADFAVLLARDNPNHSTRTVDPISVPTDDWPFLYLASRGIPRVYGWAMAGVCVFACVLVGVLHLATRRREEYGRRGLLAIKAAFVFMGIAFLLLETKSVIQFSLLFGTTWLNNSLVFLGVLLLVLAANWTARAITSSRWLWLAYLALMVSALATLAFPLGGLLGVKSALLRFVLASLLTFSPIYFANLIFSVAFRDLEVAEHIFGWNLLGSTIGGVAEYASMALGYSALAVMVAACYTVVVLLLAHARRAQSGRRHAAGVYV